MREKVKGLLKNIQIKYLITYMICLLLPFVVLLFFKCDFLINDDFYMMLIARGDFGDKSQYLIFINLIIGYILKGLYYIAPAVNWYVILQLGIIIVCFWILTLFIFQSFKWKYACVIKIIMFVCFEFSYYTELQFNKTAGVACITGFLLIYHASKKQKHKKLFYVLGVLLLVAGGAYREGVFKQTALFGVGLVAWEMFDVLIESRGEKLVCLMKQAWMRLVRLKGYIICALFSTVLIYTLTFINNYIYLNGEFSDYKQFRANVTAITDYYIPDWASSEEEYLAKGISEEEYIFVKNYLLADTEVFDAEKLETMAAMGESLNKSEVFLSEIKSVIINTFAGSSLKIYYVVVLIMGLTAMITGRGRTKIRVLFQMMIFVGCILFYCFIGRTREYIEIGMALAAFLTIIEALSQDESGEGFEEKPVYVIILTLFIVFGGVQFNRENIAYRKMMCARGSYFTELYAYMKDNEQNFYLLSTNDTTYEYYSFSLFYQSGAEFTPNRFRLGDWMVRTPFTEQVLQQYEIENPIRSLIDKDNVYLVCNEPVSEYEGSMTEAFCDYFLAEYDIEIDYEIVKEIGELQIIKFSEKR